MEPFTTHRGKVALLDWSDVNTDLIIPARYLKRIERTGYGPLFFADKRYVPGGAPAVDDPSNHGPELADFPLNRPAAKGATILVVGKNFGCGSSREHAVWAVAQAGFRAVIAPGKNVGFADIFEGNAYNNGLLPVELLEADWRELVKLCRTGAEVSIDVRTSVVTVHPPAEPERIFSFDIPEVNRRRLLDGLDSIGETLLQSDAISQYEKLAPAWVNAPAAG